MSYENPIKLEKPSCQKYREVYETAKTVNYKTMFFIFKTLES